MYRDLCSKDKALFSRALTARLICTFVFADAKIKFSHDAAQMLIASIMLMDLWLIALK